MRCPKCNAPMDWESGPFCGCDDDVEYDEEGRPCTYDEDGEEWLLEDDGFRERQEDD